MKAPRLTGWFVAAVAACFCVGTAGVRAQTLTSTEDNNVLKSAATTVQGNGATFTLKVASTSQTNARLGYLKFNLLAAPSITDPVTFTATSTTAATANFTFRLFALNAGAANFNWAEDTITYMSRPAPSDAGALVDTAAATQVGTDQTMATGTAAGTKVSFSFSGLNNFRQSDNTATLIFIISAQDNSGPTMAFASSEATDTTTVPTVTIVPEPATAVVLAGTPFALLLRRRRRPG